ncbi:uncharacterized protein LOC143277862 isoform X2 [Babylonia areolata]
MLSALRTTHRCGCAACVLVLLGVLLLPYIPLQSLLSTFLFAPAPHPPAPPPPPTPPEASHTLSAARTTSRRPSVVRDNGQPVTLPPTSLNESVADDSAQVASVHGHPRKAAASARHQDGALSTDKNHSKTTTTLVERGGVVVSVSRNSSNSVFSSGPHQSQAAPGHGNEVGQAPPPPLTLSERSFALYSGNAARNTPPTRANRFLIFACVPKQTLCGGLADRQIGLVTAFLLAYLSHRRFGIHMDTPCDLSRILLPNSYNWIVPEADIRGKSTRHVYAIDANDFAKAMPTMDFNARYQEDVVFLHTNNDLLEQIAANPHYRHVLPVWARQPRPAFFRDVLSTLMRPSPHLQQWLHNVLSSLHYFHTARRHPILGVHVRSWRSKDFADTRRGDGLSRIDLLWDFVQTYVQNGSDVFVATDNPLVRQASAARFGPRHHDSEAVLRHIDLQRSDPAICRALEGAVLDQLVLSRCDVLVVSQGSGFSSRAAMIRGTGDRLFVFRHSSGVFPAAMCDPKC